MKYNAKNLEFTKAVHDRFKVDAEALEMAKMVVDPAVDPRGYLRLAQKIKEGL